MKRMKLFGLVFVAASFPSVLFASNTAVNGVSPRAQSMQAFTAVADDASAVFYNPAGLTQIKNTQIDLGATYIAPNQQYTNNTNNVTTTSKKAALANDFFIAHQYNQRLSFGFGVYSPFARTSDYSANAALNNLNNRSLLLRVDFAPTVAYQLFPCLSIGVGAVGSYIDASSDILGLYERGTGYGFTGQGGLLLKLPKGVKAGLTFRGPEDAYVTGNGSLQGAINGPFTMHLHFPATLSGGLSWQVTPAWLLSTAYDYEFWSYLDQVSRVYANATLNAIGTNTVDGQDEGTFRIGTQYRYKNNEFRAGYSYVPAAVPAQYIVPAKPDYNVNAFSVGYSRYFHKLRLDAGYEYDMSPWRQSNSTTFPGSYKVSVNNFMLGLGYNFGGI